MRTIQFDKIVSEVEKLCTTAGTQLPQDVLTAMQQAEKKESNASAKKSKTTGSTAAFSSSIGAHSTISTMIRPACWSKRRCKTWRRMGS